MSLRRRLNVFFVGIVLIPSVAIALVLFLLARAHERGQAEERIQATERIAQTAYRRAREHAGRAAGRIAQDAALAAALRRSERALIEVRLRALVRDVGAVRARVDLPGLGAVDVGEPAVIAPARTRLLDGDHVLGTLGVGVQAADRFVTDLKRATGHEAAVLADGRPLASTLAGLEGQALPVDGEVDVDGASYRVRGFDAAGLSGTRLGVRVLDHASGLSSPTNAAALTGLVTLVGFLGLAVAFWLTISRGLTAETSRLLHAAQRLGGGDFRVTVPAEGHDEFAALGREFNAMARQLEARLDELQQERARLQGAVRRLGESMASGLDRDALLAIVVRSAVDGVGAACGRASVRVDGNGKLDQVAAAGPLAEHLRAIHAAEAAVLDARETAQVQVGETTALAQALRGGDGDGSVLGMISVARPGHPFSPAERDLFAYLSTQAGVSLENVDLHEAMARQAVTDDLTGLSNHRRFQEVMAAEVERARRFHQDLGLILVDIDDFKRVNDTYGHLQGDLVLREVARVLAESAREVDEPARYGGEEMAVVLPQTDLEGASRFAERVRRRVEALRVALLASDGHLGVTVSIGVAALSSPGVEQPDELVAAADRALYAAKRAGKNRSVRAE